jgi:protein tyrosine phosphatase (PTP) superfamily phosphohydrolase (DUF442 family)
MPARRIVLCAASAALAALAGSIGWLLLRSNYHVVIPGRVYRSGQLSEAEWSQAIERDGVRTVINLRGSKPGRDWYETESGILAARGIERHDIDFSPKRLPSRWKVLQLIELLENSPAPILVHCKAGADRAGLAAAVARIVGGEPLSEARRELGIAYGHLPIGPTREMSRFFDLYSQFVAESGLPDTPHRFKEWVKERYIPYNYFAQIQAVDFPARAGARERLDVSFRVTNYSREPWRFAEAPDRGIKLGFVLRRDDEEGWLDYDRTGHFDGELPAGASMVLTAGLMAPRWPGRFWIKVDMVEEHVAWFEYEGSYALILPLEVLP